MNPYKIAIVGLGPKGLYAFERLLAQFHISESADAVEIHLFEKTGNFGAGEIYEPDQPDYLIMNYPNRNINVWPEEKPKSHVAEQLSFVEWLRINENKNDEDLAYHFAPRRLVGKYLMYCFNVLLEGKRDYIKVSQHTAVVSAIEREGRQLILKYKSSDNQISSNLKVDEVLLTTGHSSCKGKLEALENSADESDPNFIPFVYPVQKELSHIQRSSSVGIKGLGLTFIDTVLALTEGRGGTFDSMENGSFLYRPSGNEPNKIFAFSRSGLPMIPRSGKEGETPYSPLYFTNKNIQERAGEPTNISFVEHVLPLFIAELLYRYYSVIFEQQNLSFYPDKNLKELNNQIEAFHDKYPEIYRPNFANLFKSKTFAEPSVELGSLAYMHYLLKEAEIGSESSAFMAAAMTWGRLSEIFNRIYSFGGMSADSHYVFDVKYRSKLNRISYGPPLENMKKVIALIETGIVNLDFAVNPKIKKFNNGWAIYNSRLRFQRISTLIDARIPTMNSVDDWSPLLQNMQRSGLLRPFKIKGATSYEVGCPEIDSKGRAIDRTGNSISNISFYGTPTEGIVYDNDTLSRTRNNFASQWAMDVVLKCNKNKRELNKEKN